MNLYEIECLCRFYQRKKMIAKEKRLLESTMNNPEFSNWEWGLARMKELDPQFIFLSDKVIKTESAILSKPESLPYNFSYPYEKKFEGYNTIPAYICTLIHNQMRLNNVYENVTPHLVDNFTVFPAIDGTTEALENFFEKHACELSMSFDGIRAETHACSRYSVALICSAIAILLDAKAKGLTSILFFEDDVKLYPNFNEELKKSIAELPDDAEVLKLSFAHAKSGFPEEAKIKGKQYILNFFPNFDGGNNWYGTDGMYIRNIPKVLEALQNATAPIDHMIFSPYLARDIKTYFIKERNLCWNSNQMGCSYMGDKPKCHDIYHLSSLCKKNNFGDFFSEGDKER